MKVAKRGFKYGGVFIAIGLELAFPDDLNAADEEMLKEAMKKKCEGQ